MKPIDIFITAYLRQFYTEQTINYLCERTTVPFRLFVIDQGGNDEVIEAAGNRIFQVIKLRPNAGIHAAWNTALALAESEYFITSDNDIFVPDLRRIAFNKDAVGPSYFESNSDDQPCWLTRLVSYMDERPNYGAISLCPHVFIGAAGIDPKDPEDVKERNMCGAVMRIMRTETVRKAGGWLHKIDPKRNSEERVLCSRLQTIGYKVGICSRIRAYHPFGKDIPNQSGWGYPPEFPPEKQGHRPELAEYVVNFDKPEAYDNKTWIAK